MANITPRRNKNGEIISYRIRVSKGYDATGKKLNPYVMTWKPSAGMTAKQIEKELHKQAIAFEELCNQGLAGDGKQKFSVYADYVIDLKTKSGELRHHTVTRYRDLLKRINAGIGHIKLSDIRPQHLNQLYEQLSRQGLRKAGEKAVAKHPEQLPEMIHNAGFSSVEAFVKERAALSMATYRKALKGDRIAGESAEKFANALGMPVKALFTIETDRRPLSSKTVREHHALIHLILRHAEQELLVPYNAADKAKPPKTSKPCANYFEKSEVAAILEAAESEPIKWRALLHIMLVTGGRRGEVLGLTWNCIDFTFNRIYVEKAVYYESNKGIYIDKPKTNSSVRWIRLPESTMELLKRYRMEYYEPMRAAFGKEWNDTGFVFVKDSAPDAGKPMHPDSVTGYCKKFSEKYGLKHINPHAFRHTAASLLYFAGVDAVSISGHLGHATPSTTQNMYAHVIAEAESRISDCMGQIIVSTRTPVKDPEEQEQTG